MNCRKCLAKNLHGRTQMLQHKQPEPCSPRGARLDDGVRSSDFIDFVGCDSASQSEVDEENDVDLDFKAYESETEASVRSLNSSYDHMCLPGNEQEIEVGIDNSKTDDHQTDSRSITRMKTF